MPRRSTCRASIPPRIDEPSRTARGIAIARALIERVPWERVRFFEVDHPVTQADKRARYAEVGADVEGVSFVAADFAEPGLGDALKGHRHDATRRTQYL